MEQWIYKSHTIYSSPIQNCIMSYLSHNKTTMSKEGCPNRDQDLWINIKISQRRNKYLVFLS